MPTIDPEKSEAFAVEVVTRLRDSGYEAFWAGGCVRDRLLGRQAKDYDVATSAPPDDVRRVFGFRRTLPIGASFGVVTVLGPAGAGQIEVATFRQDLGYSDGRRPDAVAFSTAEADAKRRDFTINGLFFDPLSGQVHDFVGGKEDLRRGVIRAIGDPYARFAEDKLRLLRAVRFAAAFGFALDEATQAAIEREAAQLSAVSAERIAAEMRRMLTHGTRTRALELLHQTRLLAEVLPEVERLAVGADAAGEGETPWRRTLAILARLTEPSFALALAALLRETSERPALSAELVPLLAQRWRLSNEEAERARWLLEHEEFVRAATQQPWPRVQRVLVHSGSAELMALAEAVTALTAGDCAAMDFCRQKLALPTAQLNPPPLVTGNDLIAGGLRPGPAFKEVLEAVRDAQIDQRIRTPAEALALARKLAAS